jgi:hypothetical protein
MFGVVPTLTLRMCTSGSPCPLSVKDNVLWSKNIIMYIQCSSMLWSWRDRYQRPSIPADSLEWRSPPALPSPFCRGGHGKLFANSIKLYEIVNGRCQNTGPAPITVRANLLATPLALKGLGEPLSRASDWLKKKVHVH